MFFQSFLIRNLDSTLQATVGTGSRITAHIVVVHVIRSRRQVKRSFRCTDHLQFLPVGGCLAVAHHFHATLGTQGCFYTFLVFALTSDGKHVSIGTDFVL